MRSLLTRCLAYEGFSVLSAADGRAALAVLQSSPQPVDVLIADIRMPHMSGDQLAFRAKDLGLVRHVLFITGYDSHPESAQMLGPVMLKPFGPDHLAAAVRALMQGNPLPGP